MNNGIADFASLLFSQLPILIAYTVGLLTANRYRQQYPQAARRVTWAIVLFLVDAIVLSFVGQWWLNMLAMQGAGEGTFALVINGVGLVRSLIHAWAFLLILGAVFPASGTIAGTFRRSRRLIGAVLGLLVGSLAGIGLGIPLGMSMGATTHDGALASFVVFFVLPIGAVIGTIVGFFVAGAPKAMQ